MTRIVIELHRGPDAQPVGVLHIGSGQAMPFTGWLDLVRHLEEELHASMDGDEPSEPSS
jgi:hypothetical protein